MSRETLTGHAGDRHRRTSRQHPSQPFHLALTIAIQRHSDFIIEFLDLAVPRLMLHAHGHFAIIQHATQIVFQR